MVIGIGGLSRSGKTKLAKRVRSLYTGKKVLLLHQDDFVKEEKNIPLIRDHIDWEVPESIDLEKWETAIKAGMENYEVVILEGILIFSFPEINKLYDKQILVEISEELFMTRKREDLRWGKEPEWYIAYIWEAYQVYGEPEGFAGYKVPGNRPLDTAGLKAFLEI